MTCVSRRFATVVVALVCASCGPAPSVEAPEPPPSVRVEPSGSNCGHVFEDGCALDADLTTVFEPAGRGSVHGAIFYAQNSSETYLVVTSGVLTSAGTLAITVPAGDVAIRFHVPSCNDSCTVVGQSGTITLAGEVSPCGEDTAADCLTGTVAVTFDDVRFEDGSTLDEATFTATYQ